ncbi:MAG TPA: hypothetical protein VKM55_29520 [Candidatus Lokiarchaeia archaeon]|nr:hypothetical protein [Candidatus Lokiarchaeia archaeon]
MDEVVPSSWYKAHVNEYQPVVTPKQCTGEKSRNCIWSCIRTTTLAFLARICLFSSSFDYPCDA